jgi:hypothetical protein
MVSVPFLRRLGSNGTLGANVGESLPELQSTTAADVRNNLRELNGRRPNLINGIADLGAQDEHQ